jgi:tetratricopeptide (TPR) repeat protein
VDIRKCLRRVSIPRGTLPLALLLSLANPVARPLRAQTAILPPDAAVNAYEQGRQAIRKGNFAAGLDKLKEALATGHTEPKEHFGTSRNFTDWYDPYYWLGVAYMELGDEPEALRNFQKSRTAGVIEKWPEYRNLLERLDELERRAAARRSPPEERPVSAPTPVPGLTPSLLPALPPPTVSPASTPLPVASPPVEPDPGDLEALLASLSAGAWEDAERALSRLRARTPETPEADILEAVLAGTRYVLDGSRDQALLGRARKSLAAFRRRGGPKRVESAWISPSLSRALSD